MRKLSSLRALQTTLEYIIIEHRIIRNSEELTKKIKPPLIHPLEQDYGITQECGMQKPSSLLSLQTTLEYIIINCRMIKIVKNSPR
jgi:hypothetical protein